MGTEIMFIVIALLIGALMLALTLVVELAVAALMGYRSRTELRAVAYINLMTNPMLGLATIFVFPAGATALSWELAPLEAAVVLAEWGLLVWALKRPALRMLVLSLVLNAASLGAGVLLKMWLFK
jgi:hypothetical protein